MGKMNFKDLIIDSLRYTTSDWTKVIFLGFVLLIADMVNEISVSGPLADVIDDIFILTGFLLGILGAGYIFRILSETVRGSKVLPPFYRPAELFLHGIRELTVTTIYFVLPFLLIIPAMGALDKILGSPNIETVFWLLFSGIILGSIIYIIYQAALLNMAHHQGSIWSAFHFRKIFKKIRIIGLKNMLLVFFLTMILVMVVKSNLSDTFHLLPYNLGDAISSLLVAPSILIFTIRILGLIDKKNE